MAKTSFFSRLSTRLTVAFIIAAISGVVLVAILAYRSTSSDFKAFLQLMNEMGNMMGGGMMGGVMGSQTVIQAQSDFLDNLRRTLWIAGIAGLVIAVILGAFFTRLIVSPLGKVTAAAKRVARGDFSQKINVGGSGELDELGQSFNAMAATLDRDQKLRRNMVADIAHELRTPLTILQGNVEAMQDGLLPPDKENLNSLHQETMLLTRLVEDLRTLSLAEAGQLEFRPCATGMKALSKQVVDDFRLQMSAKNIALALEASDNLPEAWVDPDRTAQVLRNLLNNAMHYTPEGGSIRVQLNSDRDGVVVSVVDTGIGIPPDVLPRVFDRFYRVDRSRTRSTGGSGLGLAIVKQLVEAQGGKVWAESVLGKGSTFSLRLPYPRS